MDELKEIYKAIDKDGFSESTLRLIDQFVNDIQNGTRDFYRYNSPEHAGFCTAGKVLIGATIVACYAAASITAGCNAERGQGQVASRSLEQRIPANWEIDERQEQLIEEWAMAAGLWVENSEKILTDTFGPMIAQGAEAKVYYREGDTSVIKERASIYSTTLKALDAIVLHNYLFPETAMSVIGFTRDSDHLMRIILTQPYVRCLRLATKEEIDFHSGEENQRQGQDADPNRYLSGGSEYKC